MRTPSPLSLSLVAAVLAAALPASAAAQVGGVTATGTAPGMAVGTRSIKVTATVAAVDVPARQVTMRRDDGSTFEVVAGPDVRNLAQLRVGDSVTLEYIDVLILELKKGGTGAPANIIARTDATRTELGQRPGGAVVKETKLVADVVAVDPINQRVTLRGPRGNQVVLPVRDRAQFDLIRVGDQIEADYVEAVALSVTPMAQPMAAAQAPRWTITPYAWIAGFDGTAGLGTSGPGGDLIQIDAGSLSDSMDLGGFMLHANWRNGPWSVFGDWTYAKVDSDAPTRFQTLYSEIEAEVKGNIVEAYGGYDLLRSPGHHVDVFAGLRYYNLDIKLGLRDAALPGVDRTGKSDWLDGVVGIRGEAALDEHWQVFGSADIGAGGSDLSWQLFAGVGYRFSWGSIVGGWRYLHIDYDKSDFKLDAALTGPFIGASFRF